MWEDWHAGSTQDEGVRSISFVHLPGPQGARDDAPTGSQNDAPPSSPPRPQGLPRQMVAAGLGAAPGWGLWRDPDSRLDALGEL